jgi:regulator of protease activity HflC (stomatin/prohibitin superfamily)
MYAVIAITILVLVVIMMVISVVPQQRAYIVERFGKIS